ncbi:neurocalcin homolog [Saccostrea echinata]|uniref:neurocalcin homolog n=1 Tax=Saccostrea echinata TaxID=191078 RepID=UPI002A83ACE0|nr:neurocalcin homolog [Saccostrea echinata]
MGKNNSKLEPGTIEELSKQTEFSEQELQQWYKDFMNDFPKGYVKLHEFEKMYEGFFPNGDASKFARHVFHAFDQNGDGHIDFKEFVCGLNATLRGTIEQKLKWAFRVYDIHEDGFISKDEMKDIISAIHKVTGNKRDTCKEKSLQQEIEEVFQRMDKNADQKISLKEFVENAAKDPGLVSLLELHQTTDKCSK